MRHFGKCGMNKIMDEHAQFGAAPLKQEGFIYKYDGREGVFGYMSEGSKFIASILMDMPWYMRPFRKYFREQMISVWMEALLTAGGKNGRTH
jgi:hypothetical protein